MPTSVMDFHERLMAAMRSLDALERDVRSCQAATRARFGAEYDISNPGPERRQQEDVASANLQIVLERRKELGRLWGLDFEEMGGDLATAEVERLLTPLQLPDMTDWSGTKEDDDSVRPTVGGKSMGPISEKKLTATVERNKQKNKSVAKVKRIRPREFSSLQYTPAHISRIFDTQEAVDRVTRSKIVVEAEDDEENDDSDDREQSEEPPLRPLSVASTGSNITVYRPPTPTPEEVSRKVKKVTRRKAKVPLKRQESPKRRGHSRRRQRSPAVITIASRDTAEVDQLVEQGDIAETLEEETTSEFTKAQQVGDSTPLKKSSHTHLSAENQRELPNDPIPGLQQVSSKSSSVDQDSAPTNTSDLTFATSDGTGLFVSDKKRLKRPLVTVTEGTILGGDESRIYFPTPSPVAEESPPAAPAHPNKAPGKTTQKTTNKRKSAPSVSAPETPAVDGKLHKRGKGLIDVGDLVKPSPRGKIPSRATMKNGVGLLVGTGDNDDAVKSKPLSWQAKGRGKGVTRAVPLSKITRIISTEDKN